MTSIKYQIVYATPEHIDQLAPMFDTYRVFYDQESDLDASRSFLLDRMVNGESSVFLALDPQGRGAGFTQLFPTFSSISVQRVWVLNDLYVMPFARRQGVAEALLERALQHAEDTGAKELQLATAVDNAAAIALYEKMGFARDEDFYHYFLTVVSREEATE
jgi:ribosomal protein S18 acetylase RimI-like enzyme